MSSLRFSFFLGIFSWLWSPIVPYCVIVTKMDRGEGAQQLPTSEEVQDLKGMEVEKSFPNVDSRELSPLTAQSLDLYWNFLLFYFPADIKSFHTSMASTSNQLTKTRRRLF